MSDHQPKETAPEERRHLFDDPKNVKRVIHALFMACGLLLAVDLLDLFHVLYHKHVHFSFERWFGFFGFFGFFGSVGLVLASKILRRVVSKDEDYYER